MNYSLLSRFLVLSLFVVLSGCTNAQLYSSKEDIEKISAELESLKNTLGLIEASQKSTQTQESLKQLSVEQKELADSLYAQLEKIQADQNATQSFLEKRLTESKTKQVVVYKDKKELSKLHNKLILGQEENVLIEPPGIVLRARIDTGAETSSIDARDIEVFERDGKGWVRFTLLDKKTNAPHTIETKVSRRVKIIQSSLDDGYDRRVVVKLKLKIGDFSDFSEFTLTNRDHMEFSILIGRNVLKDVALVDVSAKDLAPLKKGEESD